MYQPHAIEVKWQKRWDESQLYRARVDWSKPKHYALTMLPYPSGDLHIGHWFAMTPSDARARWMRMRGYNVLFPMGFDAFRSASRAGGDLAQYPPLEMDLRQYRAHARAAAQHGRDVRLGARSHLLHTRIL